MHSIPRSLIWKLVAAFLAVSLVAIGLVALFGVLATISEFNRFVSQEATNNFTNFVSEYYAANSNLEGIDDALRGKLIRDKAAPGVRIFPTLLTDPEGLVMIGGEGYEPGQRVSEELLERGTRITSNGRVIAIAVPRTNPFPRNPAQQEYLERTGQSLALAGVGAAIIAILLGVLLARTITRPVGELTRAAQRMAKGELGQTVRVNSKDELGELAAAFNQMSRDLARADQTRRQMTADIAHELRNPLTVIGGYLDAMRVGDLQPTPARLQAVYAEIQHLERIVEDLRTLSLADAGALVLNRQPVPIRELLQRVATRFAPQAAQKRITLTAETTTNATVDVDEARMMQVLDNLVGNALKHTPEGGTVRLYSEVNENAARLGVVDTGEGIAPQELDRVFERFYRGDKARHAEDGSSGLGLAIAKALVEAHGGRIWAESEPGQGARFIIELARDDGTSAAARQAAAASDRQLALGSSTP